MSKDATGTANDTAIIRSFSRFLAEVEDGVLHADLTDALQDIVATLADHRRNAGGKPRAKITIALDFKFDGDVIEISGDFKAAKPKAERGRSIFWATPENNLSRMNPRQRDLFIREIAADTDEVRAVSD